MINEGKSLNELEEYVRTHFHYDSTTGKITRDDRKNSNGSIDKDGYLILKIKKNQFKAHRIAWFLYYGVMPTMELDHINHDRLDNRICNLREVSRADNNRNERWKENAVTGVRGVHYDSKTKGLLARYTTRICGKAYRFRTLEEAVEFRKSHSL